jgi:hypothetical protein
MEKMLQSVLKESVKMTVQYDLGLRPTCGMLENGHVITSTNQVPGYFRVFKGLRPHS